MAEITMTLLEYNALVAGRTAAELEAYRTKLALDEARLADPSGQVPALVAGLRAAREIMPFAMMYIPADKWPREALLAFARAYEALPDASADDRVLADDWLSFADEIIGKRPRPMPTLYGDG